jgi:uncharacterized protein DUF1876
VVTTTRPDPSSTDKVMTMTANPAPRAKTWTVRIDIGEHQGTTHAIAHLDTGAGTDLTGTGTALVSPRDRDVPEIGDELAAARALSQLAHVLLGAAADDIASASTRGTNAGT